nr:Ger(x)C family spore germination C-terminal domain-containing protein [Neobacillus sp. 179.-C4.2 HS]
MAIVDGNTNELYKMKKYKNENVSVHIQELLEQNMKMGLLPETNLQSFLFQFFQIGQDPYLPLVKKEADNIRITGVAMFKDDRYVTSIPLKDFFVFKTLVDKKSKGLRQFILANRDKVVLETINSNAKYKVNIVHGRPEFTINLKLKTKLQEFAASEKERQAFDKKNIKSRLNRY